MKTIIIGIAALCLGTVGLASSSDPDCGGQRRSSAGAATASAPGFSAIGNFGRRASSPI